jgi:hypothetical protein
MKSITLQEISGYQEDKKGLSNFQRPFLIPSLLGLAIALAGFVLFIASCDSRQVSSPPGFMNKLWAHAERLMTQVGIAREWHGAVPIIFFFGGILFLFLTTFCMRWATPKSGISGMKMEKYWNADAPPGVREIIYIDRSSRTFFRRVVSTTSRGGIVAGPRT